MKKLGILNIAAAFLASSTLFAASVDTRVEDLEKQMQEVRTETEMGTFGGLTASARPEVIDGSRWSLMIGPVYHHARVGGTDFCYTDDDPAGSFPIHGRVKDISFKWDWGIRAGIGYNFEHDAWDLQAVYTWFSSSGSRSVSAGLNSVVIPLKGAANIVNNCSGFGGEYTYATIAKSQFDFDLNTIVLTLGRDYFISGMLALRPNIGLRTDWLKLEQTTRYSGGTFDELEFAGKETIFEAPPDPIIPPQPAPPLNNAAAGLGIHTVDVKDDSDYWGLGPNAGVDTNWYLGNGVSIFGNASGALLFGRFDVDHREKFSLCPDSNRIRLDANKHRFVPVTHLQLGLSFERYFHDDMHHIGVRLGYETQYFWRANQMLKIDESNTLKYERYTEDVSTHGLMLDVRWSF